MGLCPGCGAGRVTAADTRPQLTVRTRPALSHTAGARSQALCQPRITAIPGARRTNRSGYRSTRRIGVAGMMALAAHRPAALFIIRGWPDHEGDQGTCPCCRWPPWMACHGTLVTQKSGDHQSPAQAHSAHRCTTRHLLPQRASRGDRISPLKSSCPNWPDGTSPSLWACLLIYRKQKGQGAEPQHIPRKQTHPEYGTFQRTLAQPCRGRWGAVGHVLDLGLVSGRDLRVVRWGARRALRGVQSLLVSLSLWPSPLSALSPINKYINLKKK